MWQDPTVCLPKIKPPDAQDLQANLFWKKNGDWMSNHSVTAQESKFQATKIMYI